MFGKKKINRQLALLFTLLTLSTMALFFHTYSPWTPTGEEQLSNDWNGWTPLVQKTETGVVLETTSNQNSSLRFTLPSIENEVGFRVSLRARADNVVPGTKSWHCPRAVFCYYDENNKGMYSTPHKVFSTEKGRGWKTYRAFFPVPEKAVRARFHIQNFGQSGTLQIEHASIIPAKPRTSFPYWKAAFALLWFSSVGTFIVALHLWRRRFGWIICALILAIIAGVLLPKNILNHAIKTTCNPPQRITKAAAEPPASVAVKVQKAKPKEPPPKSAKKETIERTHEIGHVTLFGLLALFTALSWLWNQSTPQRSTAVFAGLCLFATATEILQNVTPDRKAGWSDLSLDLVGIVIAFLIALIFLRILRGITAKDSAQSPNR